MLKQWKKISSIIVTKNPWWTYKRDVFQIPNGVEGEYHYVHTEGSSMIIPVLDNGEIVLVNQYRYLCERESIELPCGGVKEGKSYSEIAKIELEEETGLTSDDIVELGEFNPYNGVTNEMCKVYVARSLYDIHSTRDETEEFEILIFTPEEIDELIADGKIWDGMTLAGWSLYKLKVKS